ncbi:hypothetical protein HMPREF1574_00149 [Gardnerella pickettii JCP7659]|nr:hypothetical protein HMPREF1574_00149 [Gardnerella pickettii JCP7659]
MHVDSTPQQIAKIAATVLGLLSQVPACKLEKNNLQTSALSPFANHLTPLSG